MTAALGWRDRQPFLTAVDDTLYARWLSVGHTGYVPPDEDAKEAEALVLTTKMKMGALHSSNLKSTFTVSSVSRQ